MPLVTVFKTRYDTGFAPDATVKGVQCTYDFTKRSGSPENNQRVNGRAGVLTDLTNALYAVYTTEAHFSPIVLRDPNGNWLSHTPRLTAAGYEVLRSRGITAHFAVLAADMDNPKDPASPPSKPKKIPWNDNLRADYELYRSRLPTCGSYTTGGGGRWIQTLDKYYPIELYSEMTEDWWDSLRFAGISDVKSSGRHHLDRLKDKFRQFKLPNVRTNGSNYTSVVDTLRMTAITPSEPRRQVEQAIAAGTYAQNDNDPRASILGQVLASLNMLGAQHGSNRVKIICPFSASHSNASDLTTTTVLYAPTEPGGMGWIKCLHAGCQARSQHEFRAALPMPALSQHRSLAKYEPAHKFMSRQQAQDVIAHTIRNVRGLVRIKAGVGTGKTQTAIGNAIERARASGGKKIDAMTVFVVPTHALAIEIEDKVNAAGVSTKRYRSHLSVLKDDGAPVCIHHAKAQLLAKGGFDHRYNICHGQTDGLDERYKSQWCSELKNGCLAYPEFEGDEHALVVIGAYPQIKKLAGIAGDDLLIMDEPIQELSHVSFDIDDMKEAVIVLDCLVDNYKHAMAPSLHALIAGVRAAGDEGVAINTNVLIRDLLSAVPRDVEEQSFNALGVRGVVECAERAFERTESGAWRSTSPRVKAKYIRAALSNLETAEKMGRTMQLLDMLHMCLLRTDNASVRVEVGGDRGRKNNVRRAVFTTLNEALVAAYNGGKRVVLDANDDLHAGFWGNLVESAKIEPGFTNTIKNAAENVVAVDCTDGAPITRRHARTDHATKATLEPGGVVNVPAVVNAMEIYRSFITTFPIRTMALVTFGNVEKAIRAALEGTGAPDLIKALDWATLARWVDGPGGTKVLADDHPPGKVIVDTAHYGAIRGLNRWSDFDSVGTLGDFRQNLGALRHDTLYLRPDEAPEQRMTALAAAEGQQAHGRLRFVHRTKPGYSLHIGAIAPADWPSRWDLDREPMENRVVDCSLKSGSVSFEPPMSADELRALYKSLGYSSLAIFALAVDVEPRTMEHYVADGVDARAIPPAVARRCRAALPLRQEDELPPPCSADEFKALVTRLGGPANVQRLLGGGLAKSTIRAMQAGTRRVNAKVYAELCASVLRVA